MKKLSISKRIRSGLFMGSITMNLLGAIFLLLFLLLKLDVISFGSRGGMKRIPNITHI